MYVNVIHIQLPLAKINDAALLWRESALPELQEQCGWKDAACAIERDHLRLFTLWDTQEQAQDFQLNAEEFPELVSLLALGSAVTRTIYPLDPTDEHAHIGA